MAEFFGLMVCGTIAYWCFSKLRDLFRKPQTKLKPGMKIPQQPQPLPRPSGWVRREAVWEDGRPVQPPYVQKI